MAKDRKKAAVVLGLIYLATRKVEAAPPEEPIPGYATLYGVVTDAVTGEAISNVDISLWDVAQIELLASTRTNGVGSYSIQNILPSSYTVQFAKDGYETEVREMITLTEGLKVLNVSLTPVYVPPAVAHLSGQVTDAETGYPIEGVKVTLDGQVKYTDAEGLYAFFDLEPGSYTVKFEHPDYETVVK